uniref:Polypeptide N-acetylgalactosaminyltransferase 15 n=1 Tax=Malurus cyaneus samueli TaxID=2593467 RepID=A0A8C5TAG2_9PASS
IERLQLQKRLGCRNFEWFVSNVYPELSQPGDTPRFSGKLYNTGVGFCADYRPGRATADGSIEISPCSDSLTQHFEYNSMKEIRLGSALLLCFDVRHGKVIPQNCTKEIDNSNQHWDVQENGMIVHVLSGKCIEAAIKEDEKDLFLSACNKNANQVWTRKMFVFAVACSEIRKVSHLKAWLLVNPALAKISIYSVKQGLERL